MAEKNFIQKFDDSMRRLNHVKQGIQSSIQMKEQFTNNIKNSLTDINTRLTALVGEISRLKNHAQELEAQVNTNTASIGDKDRQYQELQAQIAQLQAQHEADVRTLNEQKDQLTQQINGLQEQINTCEQNLREVTQLRDQLTSERDALRTELQGRGDQATQHAQQIQQLTEQAQQREQELTNRINACEARIGEFERQITEKDAEIARVNQEHQTTQGNAVNQSQDLQRQIEVLRQQNDQLSQRIVAATQAILEAADDLERISNGVPNATTQREVNDILEEIERSLQNISNVIQGQRAAAQVEQNGNVQLNTEIPLVDLASGQTVNVTLQNILDQLRIKARNLKGSQGEKYRTALAEMGNIRNPEDVSPILRANTIEFKNNKIMGGHRTKKNRKQKGGFTYKSISRRRSILSTPKSKSSRRRSSR
jgi:chromosome segregation ATPase